MFSDLQAWGSALLERRATRVVLVAFGLALSLPFTLATARPYGTGTALLDSLPCWALLAAGYIAWSARPVSRTGFLMVLAGVAAALWPARAHLPDEALLATAGLLLGNLWISILAHLVLAFPSGRLPGRAERIAAVLAYAVALVVSPIGALTLDPVRDCDGCRDGLNLVLLTENEPVADAAQILTAAAVLFVGGWIFWVLFRRWRAATAPARRVLRPALFAGGAAALTDLVMSVMAIGVRRWTVGSDVEPLDVALGAFELTAAVAAFGVLGGLLRTRVTRSTMGELVVALGGLPQTGPLRVLLARALGDPSLRVGFWVRDLGLYVDEDGHPLALPEHNGGRDAVTPVTRGAGERLAVLVHDRALLDDEGLVDAVVAAARLALENERLKAEVRAQLEAVRESRARIVEAGDRERQRIERDLHDGAQQRLVSLMLALRLAERQVSGLEDAELSGFVERAGVDAKGALEELRELARTLHPPVLSEEGLGAALELLAERSPVPVGIARVPERRLPGQVELCAYHVCREALANVVRHAGASAVTVSISAPDGVLEMLVADDGVGGANPNAGGGLRGLQDRVEATGGTLTVESPPGGGTRVSAEIPIVTGTPAAA